MEKDAAETFAFNAATDITRAAAASGSAHNLAELFSDIHKAALSAATGQAGEPEIKPVVSVRASVKPDHVVCLECGLQQKSLKRHLGTAHGLTPDQYRARYGLPADHPIVAPNYAARRSELAKKHGLGRKD